MIRFTQTISLLICILVLFSACNKQRENENNAAAEKNNSAAALESVKSIFSEILKIPIEQLPLDVPLNKLDPPADELDFVEIIMLTEEKLQVPINDDLINDIIGTDVAKQAIELITVRKFAEIVETAQKNKTRD